ncbi:helix-turn-helix transcriptional regulator [Pseudonocardia yunnanensis]|uniref:Helix-turn-helix transcriptional regulator n=1 Tax=Pseudonocardia yunnanensis TaxID=58107 RepID=A0ABW4EZE9_9PSEU
MRASRLVTLLFTLQRLREATAGELARELEVSERTIYRDVAALSAAGVPLFTEQGRGGGIRLVDGWRTRLDGLTAQEAAALFAVGAPQVLAELGMSAALAGAQAKLLATLPAEMREHARTVAERFHLDAPGWFHTPHQVTQLAAVAEAVWGQQRLRISYRRRTDVVDRTIEPLGVVVKAGTWYLAARSVSGARVDSARGDAVLTYRVDRIVAAEPTGEGFTRPDGFDLATWWADSTNRFASQMLRVTVRLRLGPRGLKMLSHVTDTDAAVQAIARAGPPDAEGWREVELDVEEIVVAASQLTGLGGEVEALDPPELRTALAAAGAALAERNAPR